MDEDVKRRRLELLTDLQLRIVDQFCEDQVGRTLTVLCEGYDEEKELYTGRTYFQAPDIDGRVYFPSDDPIEEGTFCKVTLNVCDTYDFYGSLCE